MRRSYNIRRDVNIHGDKLLGMSPKQIAEKYGLHINTVYKVIDRMEEIQLQDYKITPRTRRYKWRKSIHNY